MEKVPFFSFVIPAHNEEHYIRETVERLLVLNYNENKYEIIIIENGSSDNTLKIISEMAVKSSLITVLVSEKGVSKARNKGIEYISKDSNWVVFLDADTVVSADFLLGFARYLHNNTHKKIVIGTTQVFPYEDTSKKAQRWFKIYDIGHKYTQTSYSIQLCKSTVAREIKYNESLRMAEDLQFIQEAKKFGKFFFYRTDAVTTSTRRFQQEGYFYLLVYWIFFGVMPTWIRKKVVYKVVR